MIVNCSICGKEVNRDLNQIKRSKNIVCSKECKIKSLKKHNQIIISDNHALIKIKSNKYGDFDCYIDLEDLDIVKDMYWSIRFDKFNYYVESIRIINNKSHRTHLHRLITNCPEGMIVDHLNNNTLDNRKENLKICTQSENTLNKLYNKRNNSGCVGVKFDKRSNFWISYISIMGKIKYLCYSKDKDFAIKVREDVNKFILLGKIEDILKLKCIKSEPNNNSGYKGVYKLKNKNFWQVSFKGVYLGTFNNIDDAIKARKEAEDND